MKIRLTAILGLKSQGADKAEKETRKLKNNIREAEQSAARMNKNLSRTRTGQSAMEAAGFNRGQYRTDRSVVGGRGATGKNFSGMAAGLGGGGGSLVGAYAQLAANVFAISSAFQALSQAARFEQLTAGLELMGARGGVALKATAEGLREVTDNAISTADSFRVVAQASSAGLGSQEIERLGAVARGASLALGRDMSESMDRLVRGAVKLEPELLDELGIMVRLDEAVREYAQQNNKVASSLTNTERRQAFLNAVLEEGERKFGDIQENIAANPYDKLSASVRDLATGLGNLLNKALIPAVKIFADNPFALMVPGIFLLTKALQGLGVGAGLAATSFNGVSKGLRSQIKAIQNTDKEAKALRLGYREDVLDYTRGNLKKSKSLQEFMALQRQSRRKLLATEDATGLLTRSTIRLQTAYLSASVAVKTFTKGLVGLTKAVGRLLIPMLAMTALFAAVEFIGKAVGKLIDKMRGLTPEIKNARQGFEQLTESAKKTFEETQKMGAAEAFDARVNALKGMVEQNQKLIQAYKGQSEVEKTITGFREMQVKLDVTRNRGRQKITEQEEMGLDAALKLRGVSEDVRDGIAAQLALVSQINPELAARAARTIVTQEGEAAILESLNEQLGPVTEIAGRFAEIALQTVELRKNLKEIVPKPFEDATTKALDNFTAISIEAKNFNGEGLRATGQRVQEIGLDTLKQVQAVTSIYAKQGQILEGTIEQLKRVEALEVAIKKAKSEGNLIDLIGLEIQKFRANILLGRIFQKESESAEVATRSARLAVQRAEAEKALATQKLKNLQLSRKVLSLEQKTQAVRDKSALTAIGGSGKEGSIVLGIIAQTNALQDNLATVDARKNAITAEINAERKRYQSQAAVLRGIEQRSEIEEAQLTAITQTINLLDEQEESRKAVIDGEIDLAREQLESQKQLLQNLATGNAARREEAKQLQQVLTLEKQIASQRRALASTQLAGRRQAAEIAAGPRGLTQAQQNAFRVEENQLRVSALNDELRLLEREHDLKIQNLILEKDIRNMELEFLKKRIQASTNISKADKASMVGNIQTIQDRSQAAFESNVKLMGVSVNLQKQNIEAQRDNINDLIDSIPKTLGERFQEAREAAMPQAQIAGLSGAALSFAQDELRGAKTDKDREKILDMAYALEEAIIAAEGFNNVMNTVQSSMEEAFMSLIDGSKSAKQAFADMAKAILAEIAKIIVKLLVVRALQAVGLPIPAFANGGIIPMANGGIMPYASGGVTGRDSGGIVKQPTYLVGEGRYNEAVVPLPNGRAIPVQMSGGGSQQNNVAVTVNMTDSGTSTQTEGRDPAKLGQVIAAAVQKELMAQKSPGGLLSKYG